MGKNKTDIFITWSEEETLAVGKRIGETAKPGQVYALEGDLGTGKTVFARGFAKGLKITEPISSPTFTILQVYEQGDIPLYHFDVYRIEEPQEMDEIGYEDYFFGDGVCLVEWASQIEELLPADVIRISIEKDPEQGFDHRKITVTSGE
ncbi:MAG: tRNA (adenosine(37)-N6)-threonylcarbamoyltransferase complex ATPase subunit type 1 TsaE [Lachnospiraceae bacterium]|nr:tRNA (adenosine(37)-N6)-threonylcarbamoyltransferase complex ATPase subunit type 1 TsaE [Lachnospiraceae bacterium]MCR5338519.1 tRNA (adenosine(37)-N6)-threonylcarbamoyltransferase complex ATPase subunit type 1 TsaE [Lachnospiraceae bacterium]